MNHAISPVAADVARHYRSVDERESFHSAIDARSDAILDDLDWLYLEELVINGPEAQRKEFWTQCLENLSTTGSRFLTGAMSKIAEPLQECVMIGIDERARRELESERKANEESIEESIHGYR